MQTGSPRVPPIPTKHGQPQTAQDVQQQTGAQDGMKEDSEIGGHLEGMWLSKSIIQKKP